jgi:hypothetical protein
MAKKRISGWAVNHSIRNSCNGGTTEKMIRMHEQRTRAVERAIPLMKFQKLVAILYGRYCPSAKDPPIKAPTAKYFSLFASTTPVRDYTDRFIQVN